MYEIKLKFLPVMMAAATVVVAAEPSEMKSTMRSTINRVDVGRQEIDERGGKFVREGNELFVAGKYMEARDKYMAAIKAYEQFAPYGSFSEKSEVKLSVNLGGEIISKEYSLAEYEEICKPLLERLRKPIERSIRDANVKIEDIDRIILVGGGTRLPIVRNFVIKLFKRFLGALVDPDMAVAQGAALQCAMKERDEEIKEVVLTDVCPFTLGTEVTVFNGLFDESGSGKDFIEITKLPGRDVWNQFLVVERAAPVCWMTPDQELKIADYTADGKTDVAKFFNSRRHAGGLNYSAPSGRTAFVAETSTEFELEAYLRGLPQPKKEEDDANANETPVEEPTEEESVVDEPADDAAPAEEPIVEEPAASEPQ